MDRNKVLAKLKRTDFSAANTTLWLIKKRLRHSQAEYRVARVRSAESLNEKLRETVIRVIAGANELRDYEPQTADLDDAWLVHDIDGTDFGRIAEQIALGVDAEVVHSEDELTNTTGYVVLLEAGDEELFGYQKTPDNWNLKKVRGFYHAVFKREQMVDLDEDAVFRISRSFDFFAFGDKLFILNKKNFESGLNFRAGMEATRDRLYADLGSANLFSDLEPLKRRCGSNMTYLRKLTKIERNGYYRDPQFIENLLKVSRKEGWGIQITDRKIVLTDETVETVLTVLNNDRLTSPINSEKFDVTIKKKIG
jgi:hypothetical protein